ncbi:hypothetical protein, partial [Burkholderia sp. Ac-20365]|uniref:hypothetical protein n=1 Tax=Burkholderia sp. Ac-20365 TaxID=2703897 RepID=UPI00197C46B0
MQQDQQKRSAGDIEARSILANAHRRAGAILSEYANVNSFEFRVDDGCDIVAVGFATSPHDMYGDKAARIYVDGIGEDLAGEIDPDTATWQQLCSAYGATQVCVYRAQGGTEICARDNHGVEKVSTESKALLSQ